MEQQKLIKILVEQAELLANWNNENINIDTEQVQVNNETIALIYKAIYN